MVHVLGGGGRVPRRCEGDGEYLEAEVTIGGGDGERSNRKAFDPDRFTR
jgi:hypothetical protein